jgi:hypothetical protein
MKYPYKLILSIMFCFCVWTPEIEAKSPSKMVDIFFEWSLENFSYPIKVNHVSPEKILEVRSSTVLGLSDPLPSWFGRSLITPLRLKKGEEIPFAISIENPTDHVLYFFTNEHHVLPKDKSLGATLSCLCGSVIRIVPPKSRWIRISSVNLSKQVYSSKIIFKTKIAGITDSYIRDNRLEKLIER